MNLSKETEQIRRGNVFKNEPTRRAKFARNIFEIVYSMYPIVNAWNDVSFGSNVNGIYRATLDDPMHYCDSGSCFYIIQVAYLSMTNSERAEMEKIVQTYFKGKRSSMRDDLPRGKFSSGFSQTTLLTAGEKIGTVFSLYVALGTIEGSRLFTKVLMRIQAKYELLGKKGDQLPKIADKHFFADSTQNPLPRTLKQNKLGFMMHLHPFDALQVEYLLQSIHWILKLSDGELLCSLSKEEKKVAEKMHKVLRKLPTRKEQSTEDYDSNDNSGNDSNDNKQDSDNKLAEEVVAAKVKKTIEKHGYIRDKNTIAGATSAILTKLKDSKIYL